MSDSPDVQKRSTNSNLLLAIITLIVVACVVAFVLLKPSDEPVARIEATEPVKERPIMELKPLNEPDIIEPEEPTTVEQSAELEVPAQRIVEPEPEVATLPALNDSDTMVVAKIDEYLSDSVMSLLVTDDVIRRGVVFIDNLAQGKVAKKHNPVIKPQ